MSFKPLRNSKGVNKPFRSPFSNSNTPRSGSNNSNSNTSTSDNCKTPLRASSKRLFQQTPPSKRICPIDKNKEEVIATGQKVSCANDNGEEIITIGQKEKLSHAEFNALKERVKKMQESVDSAKTKLLYKEKNKAQDLEIAIEKWTEGCQNALRDYHKDLEERCGHSVSMTAVLSFFNIEPSLIRFSIEDDTFY